MSFKRMAVALLATTSLAVTGFAGAAQAGSKVGHLDHVFLIMMENHGYDQIINNPYAPFINAYAKQANLATNYFAVGHPSLTNYLEVVGGSNFGVNNDNSPNWGSTSCTPAIASTTKDDESTSTPVCPIAGSGMDAATPAIDPGNEAAGDVNVDGTVSYASANTAGITIADQLAARGKSWKSYQESLPLGSAYGVNNANGFYSNLSTLTPDEQAIGATNSAIVALYAVKHNPFAYFANVQNGSAINNIVDLGQFYQDLGAGSVPNFSFIAPNQCNDMHGKSGLGPFCNYDPNNDGTQNGLNGALIGQGDQTVQRLVTAIKSSRVWQHGRNAIVVVWDENDYSVGTTNKVVTIVDTNYGSHGVTSSAFYTHFSLLKSMEEGFGLTYLNHAGDANTASMVDLFK